MVYTERAEMVAVSCCSNHVSAVKYTSLVDIQKRALKSYSHSYIITCKRNESAGEQRIALCKSDQEQ